MRVIPGTLRAVLNAASRVSYSRERPVSIFIQKAPKSSREEKGRPDERCLQTSRSQPIGSAPRVLFQCVTLCRPLSSESPQIATVIDLPKFYVDDAVYMLSENLSKVSYDLGAIDLPRIHVTRLFLSRELLLKLWQTENLLDRRANRTHS